MHRSGRTCAVRLPSLIVGLGLCAVLPAFAADKAEIRLPDGTKIEWRGGKKGATLKIEDLPQQSAAVAAGYREGDEVIGIGDRTIRELDLGFVLELWREATSFKVRRKDGEYDMPPAFKGDLALFSSRHSLRPGRPAPPLVLPLRTGGRQDAIQMARGSVVLVSFWATWCRPCIEDMPVLARLHNRFKSSGFSVLGISVDDDPRTAATYLEQHPVPFPCGFAGGMRSEIARRYTVEAIPLTVLIDRQGLMAQVTVGFSPTHQEKKVSASIEALVGGRSPIFVIVD